MLGSQNLAFIFINKYIKIKATGKVILVKGLYKSTDFFGGYCLHGINPFTGIIQTHDLGLKILLCNNTQEAIGIIMEQIEIVEKPKILGTEIFKALTQG